MSSVASVQSTEMSTLDTWSMSGAIRVACCTFAVGGLTAAHTHDHMRLGSNVAAATACAAGMEIGGPQAERVCRGARPRRSRALCAVRANSVRSRMRKLQLRFEWVEWVLQLFVRWRLARLFFSWGGETTKKSYIEMSAADDP